MRKSGRKRGGMKRGRHEDAVVGGQGANQGPEEEVMKRESCMKENLPES